MCILGLILLAFDKRQLLAILLHSYNLVVSKESAISSCFSCTLLVKTSVLLDRYQPHLNACEPLSHLIQHLLRR